MTNNSRFYVDDSNKVIKDVVNGTIIYLSDNTHMNLYEIVSILNIGEETIREVDKHFAFLVD
jgi:hypothetical protein